MATAICLAITARNYAIELVSSIQLKTFKFNVNTKCKTINIMRMNICVASAEGFIVGNKKKRRTDQ